MPLHASWLVEQNGNMVAPNWADFWFDRITRLPWVIVHDVAEADKAQHEQFIEKEKEKIDEEAAAIKAAHPTS